MDLMGADMDKYFLRRFDGESGGKEVLVVNYIDLLHLDGEGAVEAVSSIRSIVEENPDASSQVEELLRSLNWRYQLVGAVAALFVKRGEKFVDLMWSLIDEGSWIAPQLAVCLYLIDADFKRQAVQRISDLGLIKSGVIVERYRAANIQSVPRSRKMLVSLLCLCREIPSLAAWSKKKFFSENVVEVVGGSAQKYSELCLSWLKGIKSLSGVTGIEQA